MYRIGVVALFPELVEPVYAWVSSGAPASAGLLALEHVSPRTFATRSAPDRRRSALRRRPGMVLKYEPLRDAVRSLRARLPAERASSC